MKKPKFTQIEVGQTVHFSLGAGPQKGQPMSRIVRLVEGDWAYLDTTPDLYEWKIFIGKDELHQTYSGIVGHVTGIK